MEISYAVGFFLGDGSLIVPQKGNPMVVLAKMDRDCIERSKEQFEVFAGVKRPIYEYKTNAGTAMYRVCFTDRHLFRFLLVNTDNRKAIPRDMLNRELLSGLFDSDGHVTIRKDRLEGSAKTPDSIASIGFTSGAPRVVESVSRALDAEKLSHRIIDNGNASRGWNPCWQIRLRVAEAVNAPWLFKSRRKSASLETVKTYLHGSETMYAASHRDEDRVHAAAKATVE